MDGGSKRSDLARLNRLLVACRPPPLTVAFSTFYLFTRASFSVSFFIGRRYAPFFLPRSIAESLVPLQLLAQETPAIASAILWGRVHTSSPCQIDGKRFSVWRHAKIWRYRHLYAHVKWRKKRKREGKRLSFANMAKSYCLIITCHSLKEKKNSTREIINIIF